MRVLATASLLGILCTAAIGLQVAVADPPDPAFVQANGTSLTRDGQPFTFRGGAVYGTSNPHNPADDHTTQVLNSAVAAHLNTVRLVNMFVEDGTDDSAPYRESDWVRVDQLLGQIRDRGMVAVLDLSAFRNHLVKRDIRVNGLTATCQPNVSRPPGTYEATDPYRVSAAPDWQAMIDFVAARINTVTGVAYRDDPTIAVISLAGEPEPPNTEECGKATSTAGLTDFYERTLAMLRVADPNHLHSSGGIWKTDWEHQCDGCGGSGLDGHAIFALADNTLPAIHTYPWKFTPSGTPIDFQSPDLGAYAASLGKPWFTEEFGWTQDIGDAKRASYFTWLFAQQEASGSAGALFWNLGPEAAGGSHDVNPGTPQTWNEVRGPIGAWTPAGSIGQHHVFMPTVTLPDGRVLMVGGQNSMVGDITDVQLFDPSTGAWSAGSPLSIPRSAATATFLDNGTVLVTGGVTMGLPFRFSVKSTEIYHPDTNTWTSGPDMGTERARHTATKLEDGRVLIVGGWGGGSSTSQHGLQSAELYDPGSNSFSPVASTPYYRSEHFAALLPNGAVLVAGGMGTPVVGGAGQNSGDYLSSADLFDPATGAWTELPAMADNHRYGTATALADGRVLLAGGGSGHVNGPGTANAEVFDPGTNTWSQTAPMRVIRTNHVSALLADGRVFVSGGYQTNGLGPANYYSDGEIYDAATDSWTGAASTTVPRWNGTTATLLDGSVLLIGGFGSAPPYYLVTAERFDPSAHAPSVPQAPSAVTPVPGDGQVTLTWLPPPSDGGAPVTSYEVTTYPGETTTTVAGSMSSATITGLTNGTRYLFVVSARNAAGVGAPSPYTAQVKPTPPPPPPPPPDPFVTAVGTHLELDGQPFTFTGMNIYNANSDDWCATNMDNGLFEQALSDIGLGGVHGGDHGVIRAWFFQPLATPDKTGPRDWTRFDRTIAAAHAAGYYVIPTLGNQWGECGHKGATAGYKTIDWYRGGYAELQPEDSVYTTYASYRDWIAEVVDRYKDDPTILAWQLLNEAETNPGYPSACPAGPEAYDALAGWASDVSALIKSIDANHLVSLGTIGTGQCGTSGGQYKDLHAIPTIDLCEYHDYDPWTAMPGDAFNGMALRIQQCDELGKPLFVGEVGLRPVDVGGSYDSRTASLRAKLQTQRAAGVVGHVVWSWGPAPRSLDGYDIGPGDEVPALLAAAPSFATPTTPVDSDWVAPFITLTRPNRSLYTLNEPLTAAFACAESGSAGLATCVGTQANGATIPTSAPGHFTFTVTTTDHNGNERSTSFAYDVTAGDVTASVPPGPAAVTTDPGGVGASAAVPIQTTVAFTAPGGPATPVSIDLHVANIPAPSGYAILGNEVDIDLGGLVRPAADPIVITFIVDSSTGANPATITVSRTNADASTDIALACTALPSATPDPCYVAAYTAGVGSDVRVSIYTTHASKWLALKRTDTTPPVITPTVTGTLGANGWYRTNVGVSWTKTDAQSAILTSSGCGPTTISTDTVATTLTCAALSAGGTTSRSVTIKRDAAAPSVTCVAASFVLGAANAKVSATVSDAVSGPVAATVLANANTSSVGRKSVSLTGTDRAGNSATISCGYTVGYALTNLKPTPGTTTNRGSTIAVQFQLRDAGGKVVSDANARTIASACAARILFSGGTPSPNCARYDDKADLFLFDLKTSKTMAPGAYVVTIEIRSGADVVTSTGLSIQIKS